MHTLQSCAGFLALGLAWSVHAEPMITAAALVPRATDPSFVGYISQNSGYGDARSCDYPQTISTSGDYVQCCPATGACPFYTACSSNTLVGAGTAVPCDVDPALTCNTGIVLPTIGAAGGPSYLACWQTALGNEAFTFVQDIGSMTAAAGTETTSAAASGNTAHSSSGTSGSSTRHSATSSGSSGSASAASTSSASSNGAAVVGSGGFLGSVMALLASLLL